MKQSLSLLSLMLLLVFAFNSCKKTPVSSPSEEGSWLRKYRYSITIAGYSKVPEDANNPVRIAFSSGMYTKYESGKVSLTGPYQIVKNYTVSYGIKGNALLVNDSPLGEFKLGQASPDSIVIAGIVDCVDCGGGEVYYRVK